MGHHEAPGGRETAGEQETTEQGGIAGQAARQEGSTGQRGAAGSLADARSVVDAAPLEDTGSRDIAGSERDAAGQRESASTQPQQAASPAQPPQNPALPREDPARSEQAPGPTHEPQAAGRTRGWQAASPAQPPRNPALPREDPARSEQAPGPTHEPQAAGRTRGWQAAGPAQPPQNPARSDRETTPARPLTVLASGVSWDGVRGSERALTEALVRFTDVLWVDPPVSPATPQRYRRFDAGGPPWRPRLRTERPGVFRLTPVVLPGLTRPVIRVTTWPLVRRQIRWALRRIGRVPAAVVACSLDDVLHGWPHRTATVLYGTDDWVAGAELMGQRAARLHRQERRAVRRADLVLAITPALADRWRALGTEPALLPNGCDPAAYLAVDTVEPAPLPDGFSTPVAGVVGQLNDRLDADLLAAVADTGMGVLLVGPRDPGWLPDRWAALVARPNVHHAGAVPFDELPRWLARIDVGLTPYTDTAFNRASFPLKTLEYLAAGRPVVGSDLPATRGLSEESLDVSAVAGAAEFAARVREVAASPRDDALVARRRAVANRHSWTARATRFTQLLALATGSPVMSGGPGPRASNSDGTAGGTDVDEMAAESGALPATNEGGESMNGAGEPADGRTNTPRRAG